MTERGEMKSWVETSLSGTSSVIVVFARGYWQTLLARYRLLDSARLAGLGALSRVRLVPVDRLC